MAMRARSLTGRRWMLRASEEGAVIARRLGLPEPLGAFLTARGVAEDQWHTYLNPRLRDAMPDPFRLPGAEAATRWVVDAIESGKRIGVFGDYDVDGITSSALAYKAFTLLGVGVDVYIPDREEGFGPTPAAMRALIARGAEAILTVDCGSTSTEAIEAALALGVGVVVIDHHPVGEEALAPAEAVVNPTLDGDWGDLSLPPAAGVAFLFFVGVWRALRQRGWFKRAGVEEPDLIKSCLPLAALAVVCDVAPMVGFNRVLTAQGLNALRRGWGGVGLNALMVEARVKHADSLDEGDLGFALGPRLNAAGRMARARLAFDLLTTEDEVEAMTLARDLDGLNLARRDKETRAFEEALAQAQARLDARGDAGHAEPFALVVGDWLPGVVGPLAGRLADRLRVSALVAAPDRAGVLGGSARAYGTADIGAAVCGAVEAGILTSGGGHVRAAGFRLAASRVEDFRAYLASRDNLRTTHEVAPALMIDAHVALSATTKAALWRAMRQAGPYGADNPAPRFCFSGARLERVWRFGKDNVHFGARFTDDAGLSRSVTAFREAGSALEQALRRNERALFYVAGRMAAGYRDPEAPEFHLDDVAIAED